MRIFLYCAAFLTSSYAAAEKIIPYAPLPTSQIHINADDSIELKATSNLSCAEVTLNPWAISQYMIDTKVFPLGLMGKDCVATDSSEEQTFFFADFKSTVYSFLRSTTPVVWTLKFMPAGIERKAAF